MQSKGRFSGEISADFARKAAKCLKFRRVFASAPKRQWKFVCFFEKKCEKAVYIPGFSC